MFIVILNVIRILSSGEKVDILLLRNNENVNDFTNCVLETLLQKIKFCPLPAVNSKFEKMNQKYRREI